VLNKNLNAFTNLTSRTIVKTSFRKICLDVGLTHIETQVFIKLISDEKGPNKIKLDAYIK